MGRSTARFSALMALDALATSFAYMLAVVMRFEGSPPPEYAHDVHLAFPVLVGSRMVVLWIMKMHRWSFFLSGLEEGVRLGVATIGGTVVFVVAWYGIHGHGLPVGIVMLELLLTSAFLAAIRFSPRFTASFLGERMDDGREKAIIVGAGSAGDLLLRDIRRSPEKKLKVVGFVDDSVQKRGSTLGGKSVLGGIDDLPELISRHEVTLVMLAIMNLPAERLRRILALCSGSKAKFKIIPASFTQMDDKLSAAMLHDLSPEDLLPRGQVDFNRSEIEERIRGRRVLITGAAGSIGSEIARQVAALGCAKLVLVDVNENGLYLNTRALQAEHPDLVVRAEVADVREQDRILRLGKRYRPEIVFHAAAHKHVPLMEDAPEEAVKNNVFGSIHVARMADAVGAERFVLISTDKAVRPSSVMGATKRIAEMSVRDLGHRSRTRMTAVRFGNVLGSAGSVIPIFKQQIERGGPVTVTHPECTRYFMTIPEAVGLVLVSGLNDYGELCILEMGEPVRIADLAHHLITMAGFVPNLEIPIVYTGLRPGEKLHEELMTEEEEQTHRARNRILAADSPPPPADLRERLAELRRLADLGDAAALLRAMRELVPSFRTPEPEQAAHALPGEQVALPRQDAFDQDGTQPPTFPVPPGRA
ncbi:MAG TPA: nucleoside-diphosphate sugar epimerase/dehydratase [Anaeromyxobacteraceae bacterium]|nr:nucleoside-diphosphate sugar epimerase/dehydratase [Anaeromyxobacteraceae bacterium]